MNERELFEAALEIQDLDQRAAFLEQSCRGNPELRVRIEALLTSHANASGFLQQPILEQLRPADVDDSPPTIGFDSNQGAARENKLGQPPREDLDDEGRPVAPDLSFLAASSQPNSIGRLGHYEILQVLGQGAFGIVFKAFDEKLHRLVAIKAMNPQLAATSPPRKRFLREARSAAAIRHENIVQVHSVEEQPLPYLVMEYIDGANLQQKLDEAGPYEVEEVLELGRQLAAGLAAAHEQGLIHRDIKPGNILLENRPEPRVKITDFGLARAADDASMTQTGFISGTPMYMAPEQATGSALDHRADLFSLGSVLYVMVSGRPPFRAPNAVAVLKRVADETPRPIREIIAETPDWLCTIISKLHAKRPEDRFQSAQEVADLLARCLADVREKRPVTLPFEITSTEKDASASTTEQRDKPAAQTMSKVRANSYRTGWLAVAASLVVLLGGLSLTEATGVTNLRGTVVRLFSPEGTLVVEVDDPEVSITIDGEEMIITGAGAKEIRLKPGEYHLSASKDGKVVRQELVTVTKNGRQVVRVSKEAATKKDVAGTAQPEDAPRIVFGQWVPLLNDQEQFDRWSIEHGVSGARREPVAGDQHAARETITFASGELKIDVSPLPHGEFVGLSREVVASKNFIVHAEHDKTGFEAAISFYFGDVLYVHASFEGVELWQQLASGKDPSRLVLRRPCAVGVGKWGSFDFVVLDGKLTTYANGIELYSQPIGENSLARIGIEGRKSTTRWRNVAIMSLTEKQSAEIHQGHLPKWNSEEPALELEDSDGQKISSAQLPGFTNSLGMEFVLVPKGKGWLGGGAGRPGDGLVELQEDFYLGKYEVTQEEWEKVTGLNPSAYVRTNGADKDLSDADLKRFPVEHVSWIDCQEFIKQLNDKVKESGWEYRLPTEAEWEYACRGGPVDRSESAYDFYFEKPYNQLQPQQANFNLELKRPCKVGSYSPNKLGLYDMHGNVNEWCSDEVKDDKGDMQRVHRGGSWKIDAWGLKARLRGTIAPNYGDSAFGLRLARVRVAADPDRRAAEYVLSIGGSVRGVPNAGLLINSVDQIPPGDWNLVMANISGKSQATDASLAVFKGCRHVNSLYLSDTPVTDAGLVYFEDCTNLLALALDHTAITDAGLAVFKDHKQLNQLSLIGTKVTDKGLENIGKRKIGRLLLSDTMVGDKGLAVFKDSPKLATLSLQNTQVTEAGLALFRDCADLAHLHLDGLAIGDSGVALFKNCTNLRELNLNGTQVGDAGLEELKELNMLAVVRLKGTNVTAEGVKKLAAVLPMCKIEWDGGVIQPGVADDPDRQPPK